MEVPRIPSDEDERLEVLRKLQVLDTPREERFDRIVRLASKLLDVPIAAISLVDEDRQWFKAIEGLGVRQTSRDVSFCGHAILENRAFVVEDASDHPSFTDNPLVTGDPNIRFYAGQPLRIGGHRIGTLCAIDSQPRQLSEQQIALLGDLRDLAERELELDDVHELRERMERATREKQRLENDLERFFSLPIDLLCVARLDGKFRRLSSAWTDTLGWKLDELMQRPFVEFVHPDDREATIEQTRALGRGGRLVAFENRYRHRDGSYRWLLWNAICAPEDEQIYATAHDITALKKMQALKDEFVSIVSHELRTPLTSIHGSMELLGTGVVGALSDEARDLVDMARNNSKRLSLLINDILDIEKIEAGKLEFEIGRYDLFALVEAAVDGNRPMASRRSVDLVVADAVDAGIEVDVDEHRLHQVLTNLISNAVKFEPEGGEVEVAVSRRGANVRVSVTDHGPGVPLEFRSRIFGKFAQADGSDRRERGGTGLGLSISQAIVEMLGGAIGFDSEVGQGSTFYFDLPRVDGCEVEAPSPTDERALPEILHVEDDPGIRMLTVRLLEDAARVRSVRNIDEARRELDRRPFGLVLLDWGLPDGSAASLLPELREQGVPVVVFSARDVPRNEVEGVEQVLIKSQVSNEELRERVLDLIAADEVVRANAPAQEEVGS